MRARLRNIAPTVMMSANLAVFSAGQSPNTLPLTTEGNSASGSLTSAVTGSITGTVVDKDGTAIPYAKVVLTEGRFSAQSVSGNDGSFIFKDVPAAVFQLSLSASGFGTQIVSAVLQPGEDHIVAPVQLVVSTTTEVNFTQTGEEIAEEQIRVQEKQRLFRVVPNYYVSYVPDAVPLNTRQKFQPG